MTQLIDGLEFHHVGVACRDFELESESFRALGYVQEGSDFEDPLQGIHGRFMVGAGPRIELVRPNSAAAGVLTSMLEKGIKFYHLAYFAPELEAIAAEAKRLRAKQVVAPTPAVAFGGRRIAFYLLRNMMLVEFIERDAA